MAHYSVSELNAYLQCPEAWYHRYVTRVSKPAPVPLARGRMYDAVLNRSYTTGKDLNIGEVALAAINGLTIHFDEGQSVEELVQLVTEAAALYFEEGLPAIIKQGILAVQDRFEVGFDDQKWTFLGFMDLVTADEWVVDNKLYSRTPSQDDVDQDMQLTAYAFGYLQKYGRLPAGLAIDAVVLNKKPKFVRVETKRTEEDIERFLKILGAAVAMMEQGLVVPRPGGWYCSPKSCQYWVECHERW